MASIAKRGKSYWIRCRTPDGERLSFSVNRDKRTAERLATRIDELIEIKKSGGLVSAELQGWLQTLDPAIHSRLVARELAPPREDSLTLGQLFERYIDDRWKDVKASRVEKYRAARKRIEEFFGADLPVEAITRVRVTDFLRWLRRQQPTQGSAGETLSENYVRSVISVARAMFNWGLEDSRRFVQRNPFAGQKSQLIENVERIRFIRRSTIDRILKEIPDVQWRLLIGLARYGGLRTPSEAVEVRWDDIKFDESVFIVRSSKTEAHESGVRRIPLFKELRPLIDEARIAAPDEAVHLITFTRDPKANLRTQLERYIRKAGLEMWPKPFQNMRSSRETELLQEFPVHVVARWMGHSPVVALKHYAQVMDEHIAAAAGVPFGEALGDGDCCPTCGRKLPLAEADDDATEERQQPIHRRRNRRAIGAVPSAPVGNGQGSN